MNHFFLILLFPVLLFFLFLLFHLSSVVFCCLSSHVSCRPFIALSLAFEIFSVSKSLKRNLFTLEPPSIFSYTFTANIGQRAASCGHLIAAEVGRQLTLCVRVSLYAED